MSIPTASEIRKKLDDKIEQDFQNEMDLISKAINRLINENSDVLYVEKLSKRMEDYLTSLGYKCTASSHYNETTWTIKVP